MKHLKLTVIAILSFAATQANAQIHQNSLMLGGSVNFDHSSGTTKVDVNGTETKSSDPTVTVFGVEPRIGYFIADNFALGLNLDFRMHSTTQEVNGVSDTRTNTDLITGPFARYYFGMSDKVYAFGELSFGGGVDAHTNVDPVTKATEDVSVTNLQGGVGPGIDFFINDFVAFEALAKYTYNNSTFTASGNKNVTNSNDIRFVVGMQIYLRAIDGGVRE